MKEIKQKRKFLIDCSIILKQEFIGLDAVIDELIRNVEPWYLMCEEQVRPSVINLWGMTGVGKTSLIKRLFELLELSNILYRFDVGEYTSGSNTSDLKYEISEDLEDISNKPCAFIFDEFQLARTISSSGEEMDKNKLRIIWDMLDTGIIEVLNNTWQAKSISSLILKLEYCFKHGLIIDDGKILNSHKVFANVFSDQLNSGEESSFLSKLKISIEKDEKEIETNGIEYIPKYYIDILKGCEKELWFTQEQVIEHFKKLDQDQLLKELERIYKKSFASKECNFNKSIIFIIGNLDEAYKIQNIINPDIDADYFHDYCKKITITDIKESLQKRFRSEQIARLGNNHIIYPSFSSNDYRNIIELELSKINIKNHDLEFTENLKELIYKESVFPTQGVRPVLTTLNSLIRTYIPRIIISLYENSISEESKITWDYSLDNTEFVINVEKYAFKYPIVAKMENLRKSTKDESQMLTAVHESGHAITSALIAGLYPEYVYSRTASSAEGFCYTKSPDIETKEYLINQISVLLGGLAAEKLVFNTITIGSNSDLAKATSTALKIIKEYGMSHVKAIVGYSCSENETSKLSYDNEELDIEAKNIISEAYDKTIECLTSNKELLIKLSEYLSENSKIEKIELSELIKKYSKWEMPKNLNIFELFNLYKNGV